MLPLSASGGILSGPAALPAFKAPIAFLIAALGGFSHEMSRSVAAG